MAWLEKPDNNGVRLAQVSIARRRGVCSFVALVFYKIDCNGVMGYVWSKQGCWRLQASDAVLTPDEMRMKHEA